MKPIAIAEGLQIIAKLVALVQEAHAAGRVDIRADQWDAVISARNTAQDKLDADIAGAK